ncbi:hypothetical protein CIT292_10206 [Citrobacter youngae ATCC 29220]|uniref:Uncharacterized protein n=1 Tax=Citrobacter youngae ATCC 29220 TaxID=500640 RepID=D4BI42_9ENTR|nr:hypothetical protein CIT292_10206 [Citrobacter youngae ATCC 29220]
MSAAGYGGLIETACRPDKAKPPSGNVRQNCLMALRLSGLRATAVIVGRIRRILRRHPAK